MILSIRKRIAQITVIILLFGVPTLHGPFAQSSPGLSQSKSARPWEGGYNSRETGLEENARTESRRYKVYTLGQLEKLRRGLSPRYVRVTDWRNYGQTGKVLNKGILFTFEGYRSRRVFLSGNFNNWGRIPMYRNKKGVYYYILPIREIEEGVRYNNPDFTYRYKFVVDGSWMHDPSNENRKDDGLGGFLSEFRLFSEDINHRISVRILKENLKQSERLVEFAVYLPGVENLSLVGNFNNWNPEHDRPVKGKDGIFRLRLRLKPGKYVYKYIADGKWVLDEFNPRTRFIKEIGEHCSFLEIE